MEIDYSKYSNQTWVVGYAQIVVTRNGRKWYMETSEGIRWPVTKKYGEAQAKMCIERQEKENRRRGPFINEGEKIE